jgi:RNA polymerase sigma-70 factor (ECF subfamily)
MHVYVPRQVAPEQLADDAELVDLIRRSDKDAYRVLYARYARYLAGVIFRLLGADHELDDIVQESFVDAVEGMDGLEEAARLRSWLVTIAVRKVNRVLLARRRRRWLEGSLAILLPHSHTPAGDWSADELVRALDQIPPKLRIPWTLSRIEQLELTDVASACSISVATAKRRIGEADQRLRRWLDAQ